MVQDSEITSLPRRLVKNPKIKTKQRKIYDQGNCKHDRCQKFIRSFDQSSMQFEFWQNQKQREFASQDRSGQVTFFSTLVRFHTPKHSSVAEKWKDPFYESRYRSPRSFSLELVSASGLERFKVCPQFLRFVYGFGKTKYQSLLGSVWENIQEQRTMMTDSAVYKGYRNSEREPEWREHWNQWAVTHKNLIKSHYTKDKETVYFEPNDGVSETWTSLYIDYIKDTQPQSYDCWISRQPTVWNAPKPKPSYRQFVRVMPHLFKCKAKRLGQDCCNDCKYLHILDQDAIDATGNESNPESLRLRDLHAQHMGRSRTAYQLNAHLKAMATDSFKKQKLLATSGTKPMAYLGTWIHLEFDYDLDYPECVNNLNMTYFKQKITQKSLNVIQHPPDEKGSRKVFVWSGMVGGKCSEETISCLEHCNQRRCIGAERAVWNCDGAILTYKLLQYAAFACHPKNPNRYHRSIWITSPETGHSRLEADAINQQVQKLYKKKSFFGKCRDRVEYLTAESDLDVTQLSFFANMPEIFEDIFLDSDRWIDQLSNKALIRDDKGLSYEFGESLEWSKEEVQYQWIEHPDEVWIRCNDDFTQPMRKLKIFNERWKSIESEDLQLLKRSRKEPPAITRKALKDTLAIANCFPNREELFRYYVLARIGEDGEIKEVSVQHNYTKIRTKLTRRNEVNTMLKTGKKTVLTKYEKKQSTMMRMIVVRGWIGQWMTLTGNL